MRHLMIVVLESLRHDVWLEADPTILRRLGPVERRFSYASWTAPSHYNLLMGLLPHHSPTHVHASEYYKHDFERYSTRLDVPDIEFRSMLPSLYLPTFLRGRGYRTTARVSMPVLNPHTPLNRDFDDYRLMPRHNDLHAIIDDLDLSGDQPSFWMLNVGETHYPYATPEEDPSQWPRISGLHGTLRRLGDEEGGPPLFDEDELRLLRSRQVRALRHVDTVFERLLDSLPRDTWLVVTSDHGELFGEDGYFGHGPIAHRLVHEVPFVEGLVT